MEVLVSLKVNSYPDLRERGEEGGRKKASVLTFKIPRKSFSYFLWTSPRQKLECGKHFYGFPPYSASTLPTKMKECVRKCVHTNSLKNEYIKHL